MIDLDLLVHDLESKVYRSGNKNSFFFSNYLVSYQVIMINYTYNKNIKLSAA